MHNKARKTVEQLALEAKERKAARGPRLIDRRYSGTVAVIQDAETGLLNVANG